MIRSVRITWTRRVVTGTGTGYKVARATVMPRRVSVSAMTVTTLLNQQYEHVQSVPATVWTVNHGLGHDPHVTVIDSGGNTVGGKVEYNTNKMSLTITFAVPFGGRAICT